MKRLLLVLLVAGCASVHDGGQVKLERDDMKGTEVIHMTDMLIYEHDTIGRLYMDASYKRERGVAPRSIHVWFTSESAWGFEPEQREIRWSIVSDVLEKDVGPLTRDGNAGVALTGGGRYRETLSIDVDPKLLEQMSAARGRFAFRVGAVDIPLEQNHLDTIRKLVETWRGKGR